MTPQQKGLYRLMLHAKLSKLTGMAFQNFFSEAMKYSHPDFCPVKPQGAQGDWKNDGHIPSLGIYFQVYSPEQLTESEAISKLIEDFSGLYGKWGDGNVYPVGVKTFKYVINDHFRVTPGGYPSTISALEGLRQQYHLDECSLFLSKDLEDVILNLPEEKIISLIGFPPNPSEIAVLELSLVNEVITHIVESTQIRSLKQSLTSPDFDKKIEFNGLQATAIWLKEANFRIGTLEDYFRSNGKYVRQEVRDKLKTIYEASKEIEFNNATSAESSEADARLMYILDEITPIKEGCNGRLLKELQDAALVIMAYFFETCDIYEEPQC